MKSSIATVAALALVSALAGCGGGEDTAPPAQTPPTETSATQAELESEFDTTRAALNQIVAECTRRRTDRGRVGRVSRSFRRSLNVLLEQFAEMPDVRFELRAGDDPTTLRAILTRISTSLRQEAPQGCGGTTRRSDTTELANEIQETLQRIGRRSGS